jgi:diguanylate cyclase (GGDEF)-like protein
LFLDRLERRLQAGHQNKDWNFAVISLDLDRFKFINESLGFAAGDSLLIEIARRLTNVVKSDSIESQSLIARITDAEFSVLLDNFDRKTRALEVASRIHEELSRSFPWRKKKVSFSVQIGVAMADSSYTYPEDLVRDADLAMYQVKVNGSSKPVCFTTGMRERTLRLLQLEAELRNAIETNELVLYYQPEVDLASRSVIGFEALVRWIHPERGIVTPAEFIPIAEETGLILPLGDWGLTQACQQILAWRALANDGMDMRVSVNLSAKQFGQSDLVERISGILDATGVAGSNLSLEMTESSLMSDADAALKTMQQLRHLGIGLHMDDFGTGYSSLNHLHRFPFDTLKIDRSFVTRMTDQKESHEIVNTIVSLARSLKMSVVAEGIETADQLQWLHSLGCHFGQGYYFAKPMTADTISAMIVAGQQSATFRFGPCGAPN